MPCNIFRIPFHLKFTLASLSFLSFPFPFHRERGQKEIRSLERSLCPSLRNPHAHLTFTAPASWNVFQKALNCNFVICEKYMSLWEDPPCIFRSSERPSLLAVCPEKGDSSAAEELFISNVVSFLNVYTVHPTQPNQKASYMILRCVVHASRYRFLQLSLLINQHCFP